MNIADDRNLAVHKSRGQIGDEIERHLAAHTGVLRQ